MADVSIKVLIIGDSGIGKTALLLRWADGIFAEDHKATIGVDFRIKTLELDEKWVKFDVRDTAGQERFRTVTSSFYRSAHAILICADVTDKASMDNVKQWSGEVDRPEEWSSPSPRNNPLVPESFVEYADGMGQALFVTSAKQNVGIDAAFEHIGRSIMAREISFNDRFEQRATVEISASAASKPKKKNCVC